MARHSIILLALLVIGGFLPSNAAPQNSLLALERAWEEDRFEEIARLLPAAERDFPQHPNVAFFRALIQSDAEEAFEYYKKVVESKQESRFADTALFKMAQYQYARERYRAARGYLRLLQRRFPASKWFDDSRYLLGQCYLADARPDSARLVWTSFVRDLPRSPYSDLAVADLEELNLGAPPAAAAKSKPSTNPWYSIQVGAFSNPDNARTILAGLREVGYEGEIVQKKVGSRTFHAVWIGRFNDRAAAEDYARRFIVQVTPEYSIVKSE